MPQIQDGNLFTDLPGDAAAEQFDALLRTNSFTLERIVSNGQATPGGEWLDQEKDEWVILLSGGACLKFENEPEPRVLRPGDHVLIPARCRHRVEWTTAGTHTVWLALHFVR